MNLQADSRLIPCAAAPLSLNKEIVFVFAVGSAAAITIFIAALMILTSVAVTADKEKGETVEEKPRSCDNKAVGLSTREERERPDPYDTACGQRYLSP